MQCATPEVKQIISLTERAAVRVKELLGKRTSQPAAIGIKVGVKNGGCSGLKYKFEYALEIPAGAEVVQAHGVTIIVEPTAVLHLIGTTLDFVDEQVSSGFIFINPNAKANCGCGESFTV